MIAVIIAIAVLWRPAPSVKTSDIEATSLPSVQDDLMPLEKALQSSSATERETALAKLSALGAKATPALPAILKLADGSMLSVREEKAVLDALAAIGSGARPGVSLVLKRLNHPDPAVVSAAANALGKVGLDLAGAQTVLELLLQADNPFRRHRLYPLAGDLLAAIGPQAKQLIPSLRVVLKSTDPKVDGVCVSALAPLGRDALPALPELAALLYNRNGMLRDDQVARKVIVLLGCLGPESATYLTNALGRVGPSLDKDVSDTLVRMGKTAVPALTQCLSDSPNFLVVDVLARIGPDARAAIPVLILRLDESSQFFPHPAAQAIEMIGVQAEQTPPLAEAMLRERRPVGADLFTMADIFTKVIPPLGAKAICLLPQLRRGLHHKDDQVAIACAKVLATLGPAAAEASPDLVAGFTGDWGSERQRAFFNALLSVHPAAAGQLLKRGNP
ncbi:MAG: hypothetical protein LLG01_17640 [Planctomycetaceae bacterium]|nr:hypothetical protein [Planctomycetaceae bacterium]